MLHAYIRFLFGSLSRFYFLRFPAFCFRFRAFSMREATEVEKSSEFEWRKNERTQRKKRKKIPTGMGKIVEKCRKLMLFMLILYFVWTVRTKHLNSRSPNKWKKGEKSDRKERTKRVNEKKKRPDEEHKTWDSEKRKLLHSCSLYRQSSGLSPSSSSSSYHLHIFSHRAFLFVSLLKSTFEIYACLKAAFDFFLTNTCLWNFWWGHFIRYSRRCVCVVIY